jgi:hypothetical protein
MFSDDASGRDPKAYRRDKKWRLVGSLPARPAVRWLLVTWFRFSGHRRLIEGVVQRHEPTQDQGKRRRHPGQPGYGSDGWLGRVLGCRLLGLEAGDEDVDAGLELVVGGDPRQERGQLHGAE